MFGDQKEHNHDQHKPQERKTENIKWRQWLVENEGTNIQTCPAVQRAASLHLWTTRWFVKFSFLIDEHISQLLPYLPRKKQELCNFCIFCCNFCKIVWKYCVPQDYKLNLKPFGCLRRFKCKINLEPNLGRWFLFPPHSPLISVTQCKKILAKVNFGNNYFFPKCQF